MSDVEENRLLEILDFYQGLVNNSPDAILVHRDGKCVFANPAAVKILATSSPKETIGKDIMEMVHPDYHQLVEQRLKQIYNGYSLPPQEIKLIRSDGSWVNVETNETKTQYHAKPAIQFIMRDVTERKKAGQARKENEPNLKNAFDSILEEFFELDWDWNFSFIDQSAARNGGFEPDELLGEKVWDKYPHIVGSMFEKEFRKVMDTRVPVRFETKSLIRNQWYEVKVYPSKSGISVFWQDITERKQMEEESATVIKFLGIVNKSKNLKELVQESTSFFQQQSICESVKIRLHEGEDYSYFETHGFPVEFVSLENCLCNNNNSGQVIQDCAGNPVLQCMCGNVICGRFNPSQPFFTSKGSFWTNCITELLANTPEADCRARTRNRCNGEGYESVALVPIRLGKECLGLLQLNDKRKDCFSPQSLVIWEVISDYLAIAISKFRAVNSLLESEDRYQAFFVNSIDAVLITSTDGSIEEANPAACKIFGMTVTEIIKAGRNGLVDQTDPNLKIGLEIRAKTGNYSGELNLRRKDGAIFSGEISSAMYRNKYGLPKAALIIRDISERKQAEKALRQSEEYFRILAETLPQLVWTSNSEGDHLYNNSRLLKFTGLDNEELTHRAWLKVIHPEDVGRVTTCWNEATLAAKPYQNECRIRNRGGKYRWFLNRSIPLWDENGKIVCWFGTSTDIHYQKQLEKRLQDSNNQLHQLSKQILTKLEDERCVVSRELHDQAGQGLVALKLFLGMIRDRLVIDYNVLLPQIDEAILLTSTILVGIRQLAIDLRPPTLDTLGLTDNLANYCHEYSQRIGIPIQYTGCELPLLSGAVSICLYRFLQEALTNVAKHAQAHNIKVELEYFDQQISLNVKDDGVGLLTGKGKIKSSNNGIGLIGMRERLEMLGGNLMIRSKLGKGTSIIAKVPWMTGGEEL
ncbi:MAG TPA: hypothetical protein DDW65_12500 [Firmicutes bacterium]|nr:hypothetical protein [Bacillota bacterium]